MASPPVTDPTNVATNANVWVSSFAAVAGSASLGTANFNFGGTYFYYTVESKCASSYVVNLTDITYTFPDELNAGMWECMQDASNNIRLQNTVRPYSLPHFSCVR